MRANRIELKLRVKYLDLPEEQKVQKTIKYLRKAHSNYEFNYELKVDSNQTCKRSVSLQPISAVWSDSIQYLHALNVY